MPNPHHHQDMRNLVARPRPLIPPIGHMPAADLPGGPDLPRHIQGLPAHHLHPRPHQHRTLPVGAAVPIGRSPHGVALAPHRKRQPRMRNPHHHQDMRNLVARPRPLIPPVGHMHNYTTDTTADTADDTVDTDATADACFGVCIRRTYLFQPI